MYVGYKPCYDSCSQIVLTTGCLINKKTGRTDVDEQTARMKGARSRHRLKTATGSRRRRHSHDCITTSSGVSATSTTSSSSSLPVSWTAPCGLRELSDRRRNRSRSGGSSPSTAVRLPVRTSYTSCMAAVRDAPFFLTPGSLRQTGRCVLDGPYSPHGEVDVCHLCGAGPRWISFRSRSRVPSFATKKANTFFSAPTTVSAGVSVAASGVSTAASC